MIPPEDLARRIRLGEDSTLELKRVLLSGARVTGPDRGSFADELASMANGSGGNRCMLGIDDVSRDVLGIPSKPAGRRRNLGARNLQRFSPPSS